MNFNKIPLLNKLDFSDPVTKKKVGLLVVGSVLMIGLFIYISIDDKDGDGQVQARTSTVSSPGIDIQKGEDKDDLEGRENSSIFRSGNGESLARTLFEKDTLTQDDPLSILNPPKDEPQTGSAPSSIIQPGTENVYGDANLGKLSDIITGRNNENDRSDATKEKEEELKRREEAIRQRERLLALGASSSNNEQSVPVSSSSAPIHQQVTQQAAQVAESPQPKQTPINEPEVIINSSPAIEDDDDNSFGIGTTSIGSISSTPRPQENLALKVMFSEDKKVKTGDRVQLRLCEDKGITVNGVHIPKNTLLFATVSIGQRVDIKVTSININGQILPLNYEAYDNDGEKGIYCPQNLTEEALRQAGQDAKQMASTTVQSLMGIFGARAVTTGTTASDKLTQNQNVYITSGYTFYLMKAL